MLDFSVFYSEPRFLLAPMAGYTDMLFRSLCKQWGCDLTCTEMISAKGLLFGSQKTEELTQRGEKEIPFGIQLFGKDPKDMEQAAKRLADRYGEQLDFFDINCGCPARKITGNGEGSALMTNLPLASAIIRAVTKVGLPVTVKFRKGYEEGEGNAVAFALMAEESGAAALTVHGRTRPQQYSGLSDRSCIKKVVEAVHIPVVGNGDVQRGEDALSMLKETGCQGVMVGRGSLGNPFLFKELACALKGEAYTPPDREELVFTALSHMKSVETLKGERGLLELRKHLPLYFKHEKGASQLRKKLIEAKSFAQAEALCLSLLDQAIQ